MDTMDSAQVPIAARRLPCSLAKLVDAFDEVSSELSAYLDFDTGEIVMVTEEMRSELEAIYDQLPHEQTDDEHRVAFEAARAQRDLPDWMDEALVDADGVECGLGTRFLALPERDSHAAYRDIEAFIDTVTGPHLVERLRSAIQGRSPFRRFKSVLADNPAVRERWFAFKAERVRERVLEWLADERIEIIE